MRCRSISYIARCCCRSDAWRSIRLQRNAKSNHDKEVVENLALGSTAAFLTMQLMPAINGLLIAPLAVIIVTVIPHVDVVDTAPLSIGHSPT